MFSLSRTQALYKAEAANWNVLERLSILRVFAAPWWLGLQSGSETVMFYVEF